MPPQMKDIRSFLYVFALLVEERMLNFFLLFFALVQRRECSICFYDLYVVVLIIKRYFNNMVFLLSMKFLCNF